MNVLFVKINHIAIEGPNKCEIQGRIKGCSTLHGSIFSNGNISVNWGQYNSCGIYTLKKRNKAEFKKTLDILSDTLKEYKSMHFYNTSEQREKEVFRFRFQEQFH